MMTQQSLIREALACYRGLPFMARFHNYVRRITCPFDRIEPSVPREGTVYDLGCGHGLFTIYMKLASPGRKITGVDISDEKIRIAREAGRRLTGVSFHAADILAEEFGPCDAITILDVLYLMPAEYLKQIISKCHGALKNGGVLIINTTDKHPRWKYLLAYFQEMLSVRLLRITNGHGLCFHSGGELTSLCAAAGLEVRAERIDGGYVHPHLLLICRKTG